MKEEYDLGELKLTIDSEIAWLDECMKNGHNKEDILSTLSENNFERYWKIVEEMMSLRCQLAVDRSEIRRLIVSKTDLSTNNGNWSKHYESLKSLVNRTQIYLDTFLDIWENALHEISTKKGAVIASIPRVIRLCQRLNLRRAEVWALHFAIIHHVGQRFPPVSCGKSSYSDRGMLRNMAICCPSLSTASAALLFISPQRDHVSQGIIKLNDDPIYLDLCNISFSMDKVVLSALLGVPLTLDEKLTIDATIIADILEEEEVLSVSGKAITTNEKEEFVKVVKNEEKESSKMSDSEVDKLYDTLNNLILEENKQNDDAMIDDETSQSPQDYEPPSSESLTPFEDDLDYLSDWFALVAAKLEHMYADMEDETRLRLDGKNKHQLLREKTAKVKTALLRAEGRLKLTMENYNNEKQSFCPRLERLAQMRKLEDFDKLVIITLIGSVLSPEIAKIFHQQNRFSNFTQFTVGELLRLHHPELRDQIAYRHSFYKTSTLVKERIVSVQEKAIGANDLYACSVEVDRRVLDYCLKLDTELNCLVDGTVITTPTTNMDQVVLLPSTKKIILQTITNANRIDSLKEQLQIHHVLEYGRGTVILLHGKSGVGKTMLASAIANHLSKRLLLATLVSSADTLVDDLRLVFREARIQNAVIFLDECEGLFESRGMRGQYTINRVLTEIERYDGLLLLATNRPNDLDEALHRRITLSLELPLPNALLREKIWLNHIPSENVVLDDDVNFRRLATDFELTGGFIKNAILLALLNCRQNHDKNSKCATYVLTQKVLEEACLIQIRGQFELDTEYQCVLPHNLEERIDNLPCLKTNPQAVQILHRVCSEFKFHHLIHQNNNKPCVSMLVLGSCQSGKTKTIRALAAECHRPLVTLSLNDLVQKHRYNKETSIFRDVFHSGAMLHLEIMLDDVSRFETLSSTSLQVLFKVLHTFQGLIAIELTCSKFQQHRWMRDGKESAGESWFVQLVHKAGYVIRLDTPSTLTSSAELWKMCLVDVAGKRMDYEKLARLYPTFTVGQIKKVIQNATVHVFHSSSSINETEQRFSLTTDDIEHAASLLQEKYCIAGAQENDYVMYS